MALFINQRMLKYVYMYVIKYRMSKQNKNHLLTFVSSSSVSSITSFFSSL